MCPSTDTTGTPGRFAVVDRSRWLQWAPTVAGILGTTVLVALLVRPALLGSWRPQDWYEHLWYVWHQENSIRANGFPSLFVHNTAAVFNPHYAFYGGTLYASAGALALVLGSAKVAFAVLWIAAVASACGGWFWLARLAKVDSSMAFIPGVLFITSPYYLNMIYGTGAWAELIAVSMIPLLAASGLSVLKDEQLRPWPALALAISAMLFTGSHNITLLWGTTIVLIVVVACIAVAPAARRLVTRRGVARAVALFLPAVLINAWFLLPDMAYQSMTAAANRSTSASLRWADLLIEPRHLFSLGRSALAPRYFVVQLPVVTMVWVAAGMFIARRSWKTEWYRVVLILFGVIASLTVLMTSVSLMLALPGPFRAVQVGYRLETYILLGVSAAAIGLLHLTSQERGKYRELWRWAVVPVVMLAIVQALGQTHPNHTPSPTFGDADRVRPYHTDRPWISESDYAGVRSPEMPLPRLDLVVLFPTSAERGEHASTILDAQPGELLATNAMVMPQLVHLDGAQIIGHFDSGQAIVQVAQNATPGAAHISIRPANPWPVTLGRVLTLFGLLGLLANAIAIVTGKRRRRHG